MVTAANSELAKVEQWTVSNKLSLNVDKTFAMLFTNKPYIPDQCNVVFGDEQVGLVERGKFLGVQLDNKLRFDLHINSVCGKLSKSIGIMNKLNSVVPDGVLINLYYSLIYPYLSYCNIAWGGTFPAHLHPLVLLQKNTIRIISNEGYLAHTDPLFYRARIMKLQDIHKYLLGQYMFCEVSAGN